MKPFSMLLSFMIIAPFCFHTGDARQSEWRGTTEVINGVSYVHNPKQPIHQGTVLSLADSLRIGQATGEEYSFEEIGAIAADDSDRIYVSDWKASHIRIFDKNGLYVKTVGRKGQGPGEFGRINRLQIINHNRLVVFDGNLRRLSVFSLDGNFERFIPIQQMSPLDVFVCRDGCYLVETVQLDPVSAKAAVAIKLFSPELNLIKVLATDKPRDVFTPFQSYLVWAVPARTGILVGHNERYSFSLYDARGIVQRAVGREYEPIPVSEEEKRTRLKSLQQSPNKEVPSCYPAYQGITIDPKDRIIVQTWKVSGRGGGRYYDVFDVTGKFVARIVLKSPPRLWHKDKLYSIEEDDEGLPQLVRYTVVWTI